LYFKKFKKDDIENIVDDFLADLEEGLKKVPFINENQKDKR